MRFVIKTERIIHETFDDEVVIVDLDSGSYYSLNAVGTDLWGCIHQGSTLAETIEYILRRYSGDPDEIRDATMRFFQSLLDESLVVSVHKETSETAPRTLPGDVASLLSKPLLRSVFTAPTLSKFTDMQELLLIDVIHDVDETGWPNTGQKAAVEPSVH